jgi:hypothetical protein
VLRPYRRSCAITSARRCALLILSVAIIAILSSLHGGPTEQACQVLGALLRL